MQLGLKQSGNLKKTTSYLKSASKVNYLSILDKYGKEGVAALALATPKRTGLTAQSWYYEIVESGDVHNLIFANSNIQNGVKIAVILQYGHGTRNGTYVQGIDYVNPALKPIFEKISEDLWREVNKA